MLLKIESQNWKPTTRVIARGRSALNSGSVEYILRFRRALSENDSSNLSGPPKEVPLQHGQPAGWTIKAQSGGKTYRDGSAASFSRIRHEDIAGKDAVRAAFKASVSPAPA